MNMKYTLIRALGFVVSLVSGAAYSQSPQADVADQFFRFVETKNEKVETPLPTVQIPPRHWFWLHAASV